MRLATIAAGVALLLCVVGVMAQEKNEIPAASEAGLIAVEKQEQSDSHEKRMKHLERRIQELEKQFEEESREQPVRAEQAERAVQLAPAAQPVRAKQPERAVQSAGGMMPGMEGMGMMGAGMEGMMMGGIPEVYQKRAMRQFVSLASGSLGDAERSLRQFVGQYPNTEAAARALRVEKALIELQEHVIREAVNNFDE